MRRCLLTLLLILTLPLASRAAPPIEGVYLADDKDHRIQLYRRGGLLYGRIVWTRQPDLKDRHNPDPALHGRTVVGIEHIQGLRLGGDRSWSGGTLYNPEDGKTYDAKLWLDGDDRLVIRGRPRIAVLGSLLGALFGRIKYTREAPSR